MLKSIVNGAEHDIVSIPMKGKNLSAFDATTYLNNDAYYVSNCILNSIPEGSYTLSYFVNIDPNDGSFAASVGVGSTIASYEKDIKTVNGISSGYVNIPFSITGDDAGKNLFVRFVRGGSKFTATITVTKVMLNTGSTALPYEPYGYQNGWEVRDNQDRIIWGREDELQTTTGTLPFKGYDLPVKVKSLLGNTQQNGTPLPDNPVMPQFVGVRSAQLIPYPFYSSDGEYAGVQFMTDNGRIIANGTTTTGLLYFLWRPQSFPAGTYTLSVKGNHSGASIYFRNVTEATNIAYIYGGQPGDRSFTFTVSDKIQAMVYINGGSGSTIDFDCTIMLNAGEEALPFEPTNGYKIPFTCAGENLLSEKYENRSINGVGAFTIDSNYDLWLGEVIPGQTYTISNMDAVYGFFSAKPLPNTGVTYDGTRGYEISGTAVVTIPSGCTWIAVRVLHNADNAMLNAGSTPLPYSPYINKTTPIYLGEVPTVRRIRKLVLDGTENFSNVGGQAPFQYLPSNFGMLSQDVAFYICSHYKAIAYNNSWTSNDKFVSASAQGLRFKDSSFNQSLADFKAYLAQQYAAGTPVTVWYVLAEPETGIVNEPLAKIGNYADELTTIQVNGLSAPLCGIEDYKDILNLSTGVVARNIKKLVLTGDESLRVSNSTTEAGTKVFVFRFADIGMTDILYYNKRMDSIPYPFFYSSHFKQKSNEGLYTDIKDGEIGANSINGDVYNRYIIFGSSAYTTAADFKSYLAAQYENGTPVTVWYVLAEPETETVTVPTGMTGEIEGYLTQISTPTPEHPSIPKWNGKEETGGTYAVTVYALPEIPTTTGQNTFTVNTTLAPYNVTIDGHIKYTYWGKIREDVRSGLAQTKFPVGTILYDNENETTGIAFQVVGYDKHFDPSLTARGYNHSMTLCQLKLSGPWQFDASEAFLYTTVEMQPGTYKFKIPNYDTAYGGNKTYYFTSTASVPVDSQIVLKWDYQKPPTSVTAYAGPNPQTKTTAITGFNALTLTEWIEGESPEAIDLGTIKLSNNDPDSAYGKLNHIHRARYGSNNYYQSGLRQLLNTDLASNNWWHPTTIFDRPYANRTANGYLRSLNEDFINVLATPEITHIANNIFEYTSLDGRTFTLNTEYKINTDKVFLLSHTEVGLSASPNIGTVLDYYSTHNTNNDRIKYRIDNGNAYYWWFRTPYPTSANNFRLCYASGALNDSNANLSFGVAPAHIIQ